MSAELNTSNMRNGKRTEKGEEWPKKDVDSLITQATIPELSKYDQSSRLDQAQ